MDNKGYKPTLKACTLVGVVGVKLFSDRNASALKLETWLLSCSLEWKPKGSLRQLTNFSQIHFDLRFVKLALSLGTYEFGSL